MDQFKLNEKKSFRESLFNLSLKRVEESDISIDSQCIANQVEVLESSSEVSRPDHEDLKIISPFENPFPIEDLAQATPEETKMPESLYKDESETSTIEELENWQPCKRSRDPLSSPSFPMKKHKSEYDKSGNTIYLAPFPDIEKKPSHTISFQQLLNKDLSDDSAVDIESIFLTTFSYTEEFISILRKSGATVCLVSNFGTEGIVRDSQKFTKIRPRTNNSWTKFHAKLFIMKFPGFLRVVIGSANLNTSNWNSLGQVLWFQDFPFGNPISNFYEELSSFVSLTAGNYDIKKELGIDLSLYAFSTAAVEIVCSVPGRHKNVKRYGQGKVRKLLQDANKSFSNILYQSSSIGNLDSGFYKDLKLSCSNNVDVSSEIIFPSEEYVQNSNFQYAIKEVTYLRKEFYEKNEFPRDELREMRPPELFPMIQNHLCHSKVFVSHHAHNFEQAVVYIGSHNLSASAWGTFEKDELNIINFEIGVVFLKQTSSQLKEIVKRLPFGVPPYRYQENAKPWLYRGNHLRQSKLSL